MSSAARWREPPHQKKNTEFEERTTEISQPKQQGENRVGGKE